MGIMGSTFTDIHQQLLECKRKTNASQLLFRTVEHTSNIGVFLNFVKFIRIRIF